MHIWPTNLVWCCLFNMKFILRTASVVLETTAIRLIIIQTIRYNSNKKKVIFTTRGYNHWNGQTKNQFIINNILNPGRKL